MVKKKEKITLPPLEVLIGYVSTLPEGKCKEAYLILRERFDVVRPRIIKLNALGEEDKNGRVRLRAGELEKLITTTSEYKFHWLINKLHSYLDNLAERAESEAPCKRRLREYEKISHYYKLTKGWVAQSYANEATPPRYTKEPKAIDFYSIKTEDEAVTYVASLAPNLRINNPEVEWLTGVYPTLPERLKKENLLTN